MGTFTVGIDTRVTTCQQHLQFEFIFQLLEWVFLLFLVRRLLVLLLLLVVLAREFIFDLVLVGLLLLVWLLAVAAAQEWDRGEGGQAGQTGTAGLLFSRAVKCHGSNVKFTTAMVNTEY